MVKVTLLNQNPGNDNWTTSRSRFRGTDNTSASCRGGASHKEGNQKCEDSLRPWYTEEVKHFVGDGGKRFYKWQCFDQNKVECKEVGGSKGDPDRSTWQITKCDRSDKPKGSCTYDLGDKPDEDVGKFLLTYGSDKSIVSEKFNQYYIDNYCARSDIFNDELRTFTDANCKLTDGVKKLFCDNTILDLTVGV